MARANFTAKVRDAAYKRSGGLCEAMRLQLPGIGPEYLICAAVLSEGNTFYEHINVDYNSKDNSIENCAVLCRGHWRWKTRRYDQPVIAKTKRQARRSRGIRRSKSRPMPCGRDSPFKKLFGGKVVRR